MGIIRSYPYGLMNECEVKFVAGERCDDFEPECATCKAWADYDAGQAIVERQQELREIINEELGRVPGW